MSTPGRVCPIAYRHGADALRTAMTVDADPAWIVGGLYGNVEALAALRDRVDADTARGLTPRVIFNGDYHWFDADPGDFDRIEAGVADHTTLAGNVEAELGSHAADAGCGCAYPETVDAATVERSNAIMARLQATAAERPAAAAAMAALPRLARVHVGDRVIGVIHGDPDSLAGWGLAVDHLAARGGTTDADQVADWARRADVSAFASSHTCLPWLGQLGGVAVINNGSGGMPNFRGRRFGLATRIARAEHGADDACLSLSFGGLSFEAIPLVYDHGAWWSRFTRAWPQGSPAHASYAGRIDQGPAFAPDDARVGVEPEPAPLTRARRILPSVEALPRC